jgi:hypothetical protein
LICFCVMHEASNSRECSLMHPCPGDLSPPWSSLCIFRQEVSLLGSAYCCCSNINIMSSATDVAQPIPTLRFSAAVTPTDHGQIIVLVAWLCFTAGILLSLVRVYIRWPLNALAGKDDAAYAASALVAIIQTAITIDAVSKGLGRTDLELEEGQVVDAAKVSYHRPKLHNLHTHTVC